MHGNRSFYHLPTSLQSKTCPWPQGGDVCLGIISVITHDHSLLRYIVNCTERLTNFTSKDASIMAINLLQGRWA